RRPRSSRTPSRPEGWAPGRRDKGPGPVSRASTVGSSPRAAHKVTFPVVTPDTLPDSGLSIAPGLLRDDGLEPRLFRRVPPRDPIRRERRRGFRLAFARHALRPGDLGPAPGPVGQPRPGERRHRFDYRFRSLP